VGFCITCLEHSFCTRAQVKVFRLGSQATLDGMSALRLPSVLGAHHLSYRRLVFFTGKEGSNVCLVRAL
jgi:hypothetical protein